MTSTASPGVWAMLLVVGIGLAVLVSLALLIVVTSQILKRRAEVAREKNTDPMFGKIVNAANSWHKHQQDIEHASSGVDPETGEEIKDDDQ